MTVGSFLCLCPPKAIELHGSNVIRRTENVERIRTSLESVDFGGKRKIVICLPGGGVAAEGTGSCPEVAVEGPLIAVLSGTIQNYAYLVRKYFVDELGLPRSVSLETIRQTTPIRDAALVCKLYERIGTGMLAKFRGRYAFCLYDSNTVRVLAARDPTGSVGLVQGQTEGGDLFVASGEVRPAGVKNVVDIQPGRYKYGWRASPRKFAAPQTMVDDRAAAATDAAVAALSGLVVKEKRSSSEQARGTEAHRRGGDLSKTATVKAPAGGCGLVPKFRTKAEVREWSAAVAQEAIQNYETEVSKGRNGDVLRSWAHSLLAQQGSDDRKEGAHARLPAVVEPDSDVCDFLRLATTPAEFAKRVDSTAAGLNSSEASSETGVDGSIGSQSMGRDSRDCGSNASRSSGRETSPSELEDSSTATDMSLSESLADAASEANSCDSSDALCLLPEETQARRNLLSCQ